MNYLPKLFSTGAIRETPKKVLERIADEISPTTGHTPMVIEFGAGMGEITEPVLQKLAAAQGLDYYAFEIDEEPCAALKEKLPQVKVVQQSALDFEQFIPTGVQADYIISSMPLSFFKSDVLEPFLERVKARLKPDGKFILIFSAAWMLPVYKKHFPTLKTQAFLTFPPYFMSVFEHETR
jgi:phospholipid N-methyltransferase